eukprot:370940_1
MVHNMMLKSTLIKLSSNFIMDNETKTKNVYTEYINKFGYPPKEVNHLIAFSKQINKPITFKAARHITDNSPQSKTKTEQKKDKNDENVETNTQSAFEMQQKANNEYNTKSKSEKQKKETNEQGFNIETETNCNFVVKWIYTMEEFLLNFHSNSKTINLLIFNLNIIILSMIRGSINITSVCMMMI